MNLNLRVVETVWDHQYIDILPEMIKEMLKQILILQQIAVVYLKICYGYSSKEISNGRQEARKFIR